MSAASRRLGSHAPLARADAADLPIATRSFGAVLCHYALMLCNRSKGYWLSWRGSFAQAAFLLPSSQGPRPRAPNPIAVFRAAWKQVSESYPVTIPPIEDGVFQEEGLRELLGNAGFTSLMVQAISTSKPMPVDELTKLFLLTYTPDLLPAAGVADLTRILRIELDRLKDATGKVVFVGYADLVTARRG